MAALAAVFTDAPIFPLLSNPADATVSDGTPHTSEANPSIAIADYLPMVRAVARRIHRTLPRQIELEDLVSAGYLGLVDAASRFQESRQTQFRSFAEFRVRGAILDSLRELDWGTRNLRRRSREIEQARQALAQSGQTSDDATLARELGITVVELRRTVAEIHGLHVESLQAAPAGEEDAPDLLSSIADPSAQDALSLCLNQESRQALIDAIESLPERERLVITLSYYEELSLTEIADLLSVTVSRVSQIRSAAIARLKSKMACTR